MALKIYLVFNVIGILLVAADESKEDLVERECLMVRIKCGSPMAEKYGLDVWRFDLLKTLNFTLLLNVIHSFTAFRQLCTDHDELLSCLDRSPEVCKISPWFERVMDTVRSMRLHSACLEDSFGIMYCWNGSSSPSVISAQWGCQKTLNTGLDDITVLYRSIGSAIDSTTYKIDDAVRNTREDMCRNVDKFIKCIGNATRSACVQQAVNWECKRIKAFVDKLYSLNKCYEVLGTNVLRIVIIIILCFIALAVFAIFGYIAFIRYKFSILMPRQRKEKLAKLQQATRKIFRPREEIKNALKKRLHVPERGQHYKSFK